MALNFPNSPSLNDTHTHNGLTWVWNGSVWEMQGSGGASVTVSDNVHQVLLMEICGGRVILAT